MEDAKKNPGLTFTENVLETIAGIATSEVEGITAMSGGLVEGFAERINERIGKRSAAKGVTVKLTNEEVWVKLKVAVEYGRNIPRLYEAVIENVTQTVEGMTGLTVKGVDMEVQGILNLPSEENHTPVSLSALPEPVTQ